MYTKEHHIIQEALEKIFQRHGSLEKWNQIQSIHLKIKHLGGIIPTIKGLGNTFQTFQDVLVFPHRKKVIFQNYPYESEEIVYSYGSMLHQVKGGSITGKIENYRSKFKGWQKNHFWQSLDAAYFFGYAILHYISLPFSLGKSEITELGIHEGDVWKYKFDVLYPDLAETHSKKESYFFDASGLLVRHDYTANIINDFATGSHISSEYSEDTIVPIAQKRTVLARLGSYVLPLKVLQAELQVVKIDTLEESYTES